VSAETFCDRCGMPDAQPQVVWITRTWLDLCQECLDEFLVLVPDDVPIGVRAPRPLPRPWRLGRAR